MVLLLLPRDLESRSPYIGLEIVVYYNNGVSIVFL